jgi:hypothetical protein
MEAFTVRQYANDMGIREDSAWSVISRGLKDGTFVYAKKIKIKGRYYKAYVYPGELELKEFVIPATSFWNDPFNKTRKVK